MSEPISPHLRALSASLALGLAAALVQPASATPGGAPARDGGKTIRAMVTTPETELDPAVASDITTLSLNENIFEAMLYYDFLARPVKLLPNTLTAMPQADAAGTTWTMRLRPGIHFTPDPAFKGKTRELTAQDYVYSIKRLYDPALKSPWLFLFEGQIAGDAALKTAVRNGKFDYDLPVDGLQAVDRYTLRIRLNAPDPNFLFKLAVPATGAVAREVIEAYPDPGSHPVGTGPFRVGSWQRSNRIVLERNPDYRVRIFEGTPSGDPAAQAIHADLKGKRIPRVDRVEVRLMEEPQSRMLGFLSGEFDYLEQVPPALADMVLQDGRLKPEIEKQGVRMTKFTPLQVYYMWMNMEDPVIGGYTPERIALRRAIAMSYNREEDITLNERGLAIAAPSPVPPNVLGHDPAYRNPVPYDPKAANALLDKFGYGKRDKDGYRLDPDGKPLSLLMHSAASTVGRTRDEVWKRSLDAIGIRIAFKSDKKGEIIKASRLGKVQMYDTNWIADFPDGDNFFHLLYAPNIGRANYARFNLPEYNAIFEKSRTMPDSPERTRMYGQLSRLINLYTPWVPRIFPISVDVHHAWLKNYLHHPVEFTSWRYIDIDTAARAAKDASGR